MQGINYHHLQYFWEVARLRNISKAARQLGVAQPTVSAQIKALETSLGGDLFIRTGRNLVLTDLGKTVFEYAAEIFSLGNELQEAVASRKTGGAQRLRIGIADAMPKLVAHVLIRPAIALGIPLHLFVKEDRHDRLMDELASQHLDIVLTHEPAPLPNALKGQSYAIGESGVSFFAAGELAKRLKGAFPQNLHEAPLYLPTPETSLRKSLDVWFAQQGIRPHIAGEFSDNSLLKTFGQGGTAVFPSLTLVESQVIRQYRVRVIGRTDQIREKLFAITSGKRLNQPGVEAICKQPRLLPDLVDGMPISDIGVLKQIAKRLRGRNARRK